MSRTQLIEMARHNLAHAQAGTIEQAEAIHREPAYEGTRLVQSAGK